MKVQEILQAASICKFEDAVIVALCLDNLNLLDNVLTVNHREEDNLSTQWKHTFLPVLWIALARLVDPILRSDLACVALILHLEQPNRGLHALAQLLLEHVVLAGELDALDRLEVDLSGWLYAHMGVGSSHVWCQKFCAFIPGACMPLFSSHYFVFDIEF